jgi:phenylacetate-CoA ligase
VKRPPSRGLIGNTDGVVWPPVFAQHGHLAALTLTLEQTQWLDAKTIAARQGEQLASLVAHHASASPSFAARAAAAGLAASEFTHPDHLRRLPVMSRAEAQQLADGPPATVPQSHRPLFDVQSSGSSGIPVKVHKTQLNRLMWMAMTLRYHDWAESGDFGRMATIRPATGLSDDSPDWGAPVTLFHRTGPIHRISVEVPLEEQAERLIAFRPDTLLAYPSNILALHELGPRGREALKSVTVFRTIGETLPPDLRDLLSKKARVADCYSAEEVGYIALQCADTSLYHIMAETLIVEILRDDGKPCRKGEVGRVVVTDLHNLAMPIIRYDTGDYAASGGRCPCGRGLPTISRIAGRWRGMITKPDGSRHWPLTGFYGYRKIAPIRHYQMIQHTVDQIELRLVMAKPLTPAQHDALIAHLHKAIDPGIRFDIQQFSDRLPPGPRGKTDEFISLIGTKP